MREPLYLRGNIWWCRVRNPFGGRHRKRSTGCRDRKAAVLRWRELERQSVSPPDPAANPTPLGDALDRRLEERRSAGRSQGTLDMLDSKARHLTRILGSETPLAAIGAPEVDDYIARRLKEKAARVTIQKELVTLRGALKLARRRGEYKRAVEEVMPLDFSPQYRPRERALSEREIAMLLEELPPRRAAIVAFILATGATYPSEVQGLRAGDIDKRKWMVLLRGTKRATRHRHVPIVSFAKAWLTLAIAGQPFEKWTNVCRDLRAAAARLSTCSRCRAAGEIRPDPKCKSCERITKFLPVTPNDLRRSVATLLRARGVEPSLIGTYLGHKDSTMAERVYGRLAPEQLAHLLEQRLRGTAGVQWKVQQSR